MGFLLPGYFIPRHFSLNYWASRYSHWPGFLIRVKRELLGRDLPEQLKAYIVSRIEF